MFIDLTLYSTSVHSIIDALQMFCGDDDDNDHQAALIMFVERWCSNARSDASCTQVSAEFLPQQSSQPGYSSSEPWPIPYSRSAYLCICV